MNKHFCLIALISICLVEKAYAQINQYFEGIQVLESNDPLFQNGSSFQCSYFGAHLDGHGNDFIIGVNGLDYIHRLQFDLNNSNPATLMTQSFVSPTALSLTNAVGFLYANCPNTNVPVPHWMGYTGKYVISVVDNNPGHLVLSAELGNSNIHKVDTIYQSFLTSQPDPKIFGLDSANLLIQGIQESGISCYQLRNGSWELIDSIDSGNRLKSRMNNGRIAYRQLPDSSIHLMELANGHWSDREIVSAQDFDGLELISIHLNGTELITACKYQVQGSDANALKIYEVDALGNYQHKQTLEGTIVPDEGGYPMDFRWDPIPYRIAINDKLMALSFPAASIKDLVSPPDEYLNVGIVAFFAKGTDDLWHFLTHLMPISYPYHINNTANFGNGYLSLQFGQEMLLTNKLFIAYADARHCYSCSVGHSLQMQSEVQVYKINWDAIDAYINSLTSIVPAEESHIQLGPNPSTSQLSIVSDVSVQRLEIRNLVGELILMICANIKI